jgi:hypothetical protein
MIMTPGQVNVDRGEYKAKGGRKGDLSVESGGTVRRPCYNWGSAISLAKI